MQPDDHLRDVLRALSPRPAETPLDRALRDGGDVVRDPNAPNEEALALVRAAARSGVEPEAWGDESFIGPRLSDLDPASLVAREAGCSCRWYDDGDGESGPHVAVDLDDACPLHGDPDAPVGPAPRSSDPLVNEALGAYDASDVFKVAFTQRYGVL